MPSIAVLRCLGYIKFNFSIWRYLLIDFWRNTARIWQHNPRGLHAQLGQLPKTIRPIAGFLCRQAVLRVPKQTNNDKWGWHRHKETVRTVHPLHNRSRSDFGCDATRDYHPSISVCSSAVFAQDRIDCWNDSLNRIPWYSGAWWIPGTKSNGDYIRP